MRASTLIIILFAVFVTVAPSIAAPYQEIVKPQGLLILGDFMHWTTLRYEYSGHESDIPGVGTRTNRFREKYHVFLNSAVLDPHVLYMSLDGEVGFEQARVSQETAESQTSRNNQYQYNLNGSIFDRSRLPINFVSSRQQRTVVTPYSPEYTYDTFINGVTGVFHSKQTPFMVRYWRMTTELSGQSNDYTTTSNNYYLQAEYNKPDITSSRVTATATTQRQKNEGQGEINSDSYSFGLANSLNLDRRKKYVLSSSAQFAESESDDYNQRSMHWYETLNCHFGKALLGTLNYRYDYDKTENFEYHDQTSKFNEVNGTLTHHLFSSLDTAITGRYRSGEILDGTESIYGGSASATYRKNLPKGSRLLMSFTGGYEVTDRQLSGDQYTLRDEEHRGVQQGGSITLRVPETLLFVSSVKSRNPDITYMEGLDYSVNLPLGRVDILLGGRIASGTDLFISYTVELASKVKYRTNTIAAGMDLSLLQNRYHIAGNVMSQNRSVVSNHSTYANLYDSRSAMIHADANFAPHSFNVEYGQYETGPTNYEYWEGGWLVNYLLNRQSFSFRARDRYLTSKANGTTRSDSWENTAEFGATYARPFFTWANLTSSLNYVNTHGSDIDRDYVYARVNIQGRINKLYISLIGQSVLRIFADETMRDDYVMVELKRYF